MLGPGRCTIHRSHNVVISRPVQLFTEQDALFFGFNWYLARDNMVLTAAPALLMSVFVWVVLTATVPIEDNRLYEAIKRTRDKEKPGLLRTAPYSTFSSFHPMRKEVQEQRDEIPEGDEALIKPDRGYKHQLPLPPYCCTHGRRVEFCDACSHPSDYCASASQALLDHWELRFDPLLARSCARLCSEVYNDFITDDERSGLGFSERQHLKVHMHGLRL